MMNNTQTQTCSDIASVIHPHEWRMILQNHNSGIPEFQKICCMLVLEIENLANCLASGESFSPLWTLDDLPESVEED